MALRVAPEADSQVVPRADEALRNHSSASLPDDSDEEESSETADAPRSAWEEGRPVRPRRYRNVKWQCQWRSGFRDFPEDVCDRIEEHFQNGHWMARMKSYHSARGKPQEIYFADMVLVQYVGSKDKGDAGVKLRKVQRVPKESCCGRILRRIKTMWKMLFRGDERWWHTWTRADFEERRKAQRLTPLELERERQLKLYNTESCFFRLVESHWFSTLAMLFIIANCAWIGIDVDLNHGTTVLDTKTVFFVADNVFCSWFTLELLLRFACFKKCRSCLQDTWWLFDAALVGLMMIETWALNIAVQAEARHGRHLEEESAEEASRNSNLRIFTALRTLRLLRIGRLTRLFKVFPQLLVLFLGVAEAFQSLIFTLLMEAMLIFWFGVLMRSLAEMDEDLKALKFDTLPHAMWQLLLRGTFMDLVADWLEGILEAGSGYVLILLGFIFLSNLTMLNMLVGIIVETLTKIASAAESRAQRKELEVTLMRILESYDWDGDGHLRRCEFARVLENSDMQAALYDKGIDIEHVAMLEHFFFQELTPGQEDKVRFQDFIEKVFELRGSNGATVTDVAELRTSITKQIDRLRISVAPAPTAAIGVPAGPAAAVAAAAAPPLPKALQQPQLQQQLLQQLLWQVMQVLPPQQQQPSHPAFVDHILKKLDRIEADVAELRLRSGLEPRGDLA